MTKPECKALLKNNGKQNLELEASCVSSSTAADDELLGTFDASYIQVGHDLFQAFAWKSAKVCTLPLTLQWSRAKHRLHLRRVA